jgi:HlyD family secretion protein
MELKPGMTAAAEIELDRRTGVVRVPNTAIRFRPTTAMFAALGQPEPAPPSGAPEDAGADRVVRVSARPAGAAAGTRGRVWVLENGALREVAVRLGLADGTYTEVLGDSLAVGATIVTSISVGTADTTTTAAPAPSGAIFGTSGGGGRGRS